VRGRLARKGHLPFQRTVRDCLVLPSRAPLLRVRPVRLVGALEEELFLQGDRLTELGLPMMPMMAPPRMMTTVSHEARLLKMNRRRRRTILRSRCWEEKTRRRRVVKRCAFPY